MRREDPARVGPKVLKVMFSKWNTEILALLYTRGTMRFYDIFKALGPIGTATLSKKLNQLEEEEIVNRSVLDTKPPTVRYALTDKGATFFELGEPMLLYLTYHEALASEK